MGVLQHLLYLMSTTIVVFFTTFFNKGVKWCGAGEFQAIKNPDDTGFSFGFSYCL
jgi:hypothetical protein